jgi:hypothetical protein
MTSDQTNIEEKPELCNAVSKRGRACKYPAIKNGKCGRCIKKRSSPKPFKKGIDNPRGLSFGGRGWQTFLGLEIINLAEKALSTPDYYNLSQEIEYANVELAVLAGQLAEGTGYPFQKWTEFKSLLKSLNKHLRSGDAESLVATIKKMEEIAEYCSENNLLREQMYQMIDTKADLIKREQAIKEKEQMYVPLDKMMVFAAQLIQGIDAIMPKHDREARKYRQGLYSLLAAKFGFEKQKTNRLTPLPEDLTYTDDDYISDEEIELLDDLSEDYS